MKKKAFTLIELVITIVIIGIVSLSFPLIMMQTGKNIALATQQEAILAAKTYIGTILSYSWDTNTIYFGDRAMILETTNSTHAADDEFNRVIGTNLRAGNIDGIGRRRLSVDSIYPAVITSPAPANPASINDFGGQTQILNTAAADMDYMFQLELTSSIAYVSDSSNYSNQTLDFEFNTGGAGNITNIKMITVNVVDVTGDTDVNVTLRAYSANIGEYDMLRKGLGDW
ncbi:MAG: prepilin-type N-terminal cleavage/methylation domain-containing protein [Campylobacteraceae bacterium]|jgi:prepilin-type N-terminal cleavage/methylation domain-containing protein|nr:prepilin-type N-terminal cleavage/methylation domain-containing protein [Campylobacteraceae bacterium]